MLVSHSTKSLNFWNKSRSDCSPERGSLVINPEQGGTLETLPEPEEEANEESDATTSAETGVTLSETGGLEIVEGAEDIVIGVLGMIALKMDAINKIEF